MTTPKPMPSHPSAGSVPVPPVRLTSHELLQHARAVQIEHDGKIYELRVTRLNKLILTA